MNRSGRRVSWKTARNGRPGNLCRSLNSWSPSSSSSSGCGLDVILDIGDLCFDCWRFCCCCFCTASWGARLPNYSDFWLDNFPFVHAKFRRSSCRWPGNFVNYFVVFANLFTKDGLITCRLFFSSSSYASVFYERLHSSLSRSRRMSIAYWRGPLLVTAGFYLEMSCRLFVAFDNGPSFKYWTIIFLVGLKQ